ncbi:hypothetical protein AB0G02_18730, partial [Actinosynnema sp. NPDC023658]|uniref:hypothetical protein n=1 Tax=Actinosynnema sp. NPDC023658 TaxID=3155465 RepID=UPI0033FD308A
MTHNNSFWQRFLSAMADSSPAFARAPLGQPGSSLLSAMADSAPATHPAGGADAYTVDSFPHHEEFTVELPSQEEAFTFSARVRATWRVTDPIAAVRLYADSPGPEVRHHLERRLRELSRNFKPESGVEAEKSINLEFNERQLHISDAIVVTHCDVALSLDATTAAHVASWTLAARERERLDQVRQTEIFEHELNKQRAEHQHQLDAMKQRYELALKRERIEFYADALQS